MARAPKAAQAAEELNTDITNEELQLQIEQLKTDIAAIAETLGNLGTQKVRNATSSARAFYNDAYEQGEDFVDDLLNRTCEIEKQLSDTVRERPITSLATAVGVGYLLALIFRR